MSENDSHPSSTLSQSAVVSSSTESVKSDSNSQNLPTFKKNLVLKIAVGFISILVGLVVLYLKTEKKAYFTSGCPVSTTVKTEVVGPFRTVVRSESGELFLATVKGRRMAIAGVSLLLVLAGVTVALILYFTVFKQSTTVGPKEPAKIENGREGKCKILMVENHRRVIVIVENQHRVIVIVENQHRAAATQSPRTSSMRSTLFSVSSFY
jgi:hypothetical protein